MMDRALVEELLRRRIGLDPSSTGPALIARAIRARMSALGLAEVEADRYRTLVNRSEREFQALVEEIVVSESWFFRDEHPFALLADRAAAGWLGDAARPPLRALSIPCAGGEEPYSIAIAVLDRGLAPARFHVDAVDVSRSALDSARRAVYTENAFRTSDLSFRDRHFELTPAGYVLSAEVRSAVDFHSGNLLDPGLLADRPPYDVIFCRNLLIYLDEPARRLTLDHLDRLLSSEGLLVLGHAEQLGFLSPLFRRAGDRRCFAFERVPRPSGEGVARPEVPRGRAILPVARKSIGPPAPLPKRHAGRPSLKPAIPVPSPPAANVAAEKNTDVTPLLERASQLADQGFHDEAAELCQQQNLRNGPSAAAFFLLGSIHQAAGDRSQAERCFEKAAYLDPRHEESLLALSLLAQRRGDHAAAAGYRRRAERAFQEKHPR